MLMKVTRFYEFLSVILSWYVLTRYFWKLDLEEIERKRFALKI